MPTEYDYTTSGLIARTGYALGARGIDMIATVQSGGQADVAFPIYDGHGNLIAQARRAQDGQGNPYLTLEAVRGFDAWGRV